MSRDSRTCFTYIIGTFSRGLYRARQEYERLSSFVQYCDQTFGVRLFVLIMIVYGFLVYELKIIERIILKIVAKIDMEAVSLLQEKTKIQNFTRN